MIDLGIVRPGSTIRIPFSSFDKDDGSSITMTNYAAADILVYKDGSTTERASTAGFTATTDFDTKTGKHLAIIDLADNTTAGFWNAGSEYLVAIDAVTVDTVTTGGWIARFVIGYDGAMINTTIASLTTQTSFTLTTGPAEDDALNGCTVIIHDIASAVQCGMGIISDYTGASKTVTLAAGTTFTAAAGDNISVMFPQPMQPTVAGRTLDVSTTGEAGVDWANVGGQTTVVGLTGTTIKTATDVETDTADIQTRIPAALVGGRIDANVGAISSDATAADNAEAFFDGTGYAGTNNVIPTVTTVNGLAANVITAASIAADASTEIRSLASGTSDSGSATTMVDAARTESDTDYWKGMLIVFTSGNIIGQARVITAFDAVTDTITFSPATTQAVSTQTYEIWPAGDFLRPTTTGRTLDVSAGGEAGLDWANIGSPTTAQNLSATNIDVDQVVASVSGAVGSVTGGVTVTTNNDKTGYSLTATTGLGNQTSNITGNLSGSVGSVTGAVGSVTAGVSVANGGIATTSFAAGAIDAAALSADAGAELADAFLDRNMATGTDSGTNSTAIRTPRQALRALRNKVSVSGGTATITKEDDTTTSWTTAIGTTAGNPVSSSDPT